MNKEQLTALITSRPELLANAAKELEDCHVSMARFSRAMAKSIRVKVDALIAEGFTYEQAIEIMQKGLL